MDEAMPPADRLALVTGTSSGIGAAVARALLERGWTVVGLSRRPAGFDSPGYRHLPADLADLAGLQDLAARELVPLLRDGRWRRVGLVNNAAATGSMGPVDQLDPLELADVFAVNTVAPMFLMGLAIREVADGAQLRIVNVSTGAAVQPFPGLGDYGSSKAALRLASMIQAVELASDERPGGRRPGVAIMSYSPGVVATPMQERAREPGRPWNQPFVDFHATGQLLSAAVPAAEIAGFLEQDSPEPFSERRVGAG